MKSYKIPVVSRTLCHLVTGAREVNHGRCAARYRQHCVKQLKIDAAAGNLAVADANGRLGFRWLRRRRRSWGRSWLGRWRSRRYAAVAWRAETTPVIPTLATLNGRTIVSLAVLDWRTVSLSILDWRAVASAIVT
jgi:hypothetical protein